MAPDTLRERLQPAMIQDLDAVWDEWILEVERPDPVAFVEHLAAWSLIEASTASAVLRFLDAPSAGRIDEISEEYDDEAATMHYASWNDTDEVTPDPDGVTRVDNPLLGWDDTSEELDPEAETLVGTDPEEILARLNAARPKPTPPPVPEEPLPDDPTALDPKATPARRARFRKVTGGLRETGGWDDPAASAGRTEESAPSDPSGRYRFIDVVGEGAMGRVHRAEDHQLHRAVAYKSMSSDVASQRTLASKFTAEAQITAQLDHPGVVPVYDLASDRAYTMKLVEGRTLRELIDEAREAREARRLVHSEVRRDRLIDLLARVCDTVAYAHARGVIHRDLKPENIMVGAFGEVYVMDWGIARVFDDAVPRPVVVKAAEDEGDLVIGTPGHMSPEQADGHNAALDGKSDQYALGLVLFEILALAPAVTAKTSRALVVRQQEGELDPLVQRYGERLPRELTAIARRALQLDPARRYPTVADLASDLRRYLVGDAVTARPDGITQRAARWLSRHRELTLVLFGLLLTGTAVAIAGGAGVTWWQHNAAQAREQRLATVLTTSARQASLVEGQFLKLEGLLSVVSTAAGEALRVPAVEATEEPAASTLYTAATFADPSTAPPDVVMRSAAERYGPGLVSVRHPAFLLPEGDVDPRWEALADGARRHLPRVLLRSHSEQRATVTEALARQTILDREIPVAWAWVTLEDGLYLGFPGHGGYPEALDPRTLPAYLRAHDQQAPVWGAVEPHPSGRGEVLTVSQALLDDQGGTLGVAGLDVSVAWLVDKMLVPEELSAVPGVVGLLLDADGGVIVQSGGASAVASPYRVEAVVDAVRSRRSGHVVATAPSGEPVLVLYNRMARIGWTHVVEGPPEPLLGL